MKQSGGGHFNPVCMAPLPGSTVMMVARSGDYSLTLTCPNAIKMAAEDVKPLITGKEMNWITKPEKITEIPMKLF